MMIKKGYENYPFFCLKTQKSLQKTVETILLILVSKICYMIYFQFISCTNKKGGSKKFLLLNFKVKPLKNKLVPIFIKIKINGCITVWNIVKTQKNIILYK